MDITDFSTIHKDIILELTSRLPKSGQIHCDRYIITKSRFTMKSALPFFVVMFVILSAICANAQQVNVQLNRGVNLISINVTPPGNMFAEDENRGPSIPLMYERLRLPNGAHQVAQVRDESGRFYAPQDNFNNIPFWDLADGYSVTVLDDAETTWEGIIIAPDADIGLNDGWNLISYFPNYRLDASAEDFYVLSPIIDDVIIAKDSKGHFMIPEFEFSNMEPWRLGQGYYVRVENDVVLNYPEEREEEFEEREAGDHWELALATDNNMSLLITDIAGPEGFEPDEGDQIGAFTGADVLTGLGDVHDGMCGIAVWGADNIFDNVGYLERNQNFRLVYWDDDQELEADIEVERFLQGNGLFRPNDLVVAEIAVDIEIVARRLDVQLNEGWNLTSINVTPPENLWEREEGPDIILMTEHLRIDENNHHIQIMKNGAGQFYTPEFEFNGIPYWDLTEAYLVKVDEDIETSWRGVPIPADTDIDLNVGWNYTAYYPTYELDAGAPDFYVLSPIIENVEIAKDNEGHFLVPEFEFSDMLPWRETQGYLIKVNDDVTLNYPPEQDDERAASTWEAAISKGYWSDPVQTCHNMSVLVTSVSGTEVGVDDQIAAFSDRGNIVGVGTINSDGRCGLAVWSDDPTTDIIDGLLEGESFSLSVWSATDQFELGSSIVAVHKGMGLVYETDGFVALDLEVNADLPVSFYLSQAYPNPFNATTKLNFGVPEEAMVSIEIYDVAGRRIATLTEKSHESGHHSVVWNSGTASPGVYLVKMEVDDFKSVRKVILVK